jgi:hypothetical protein
MKIILNFLQTYTSVRFGMRIDFEGSFDNLHKYSDLNNLWYPASSHSTWEMGIVDFQFENQIENWPRTDGFLIPAQL